eukprot:1713412-Prymnesium_polylepis.1
MSKKAPSTDGSFFVTKHKGALPSAEPVIIEGRLIKRGGSHGNAATWRPRYCRLIAHTLYYSETAKAAQCKGSVSMQGLMVRDARPDEAGGRRDCLHVCWMDGDRPLLMQAPTAEARDAWLDALREAAQATADSLKLLDLESLRQRCKHCGLAVPAVFDDARPVSSLELNEHRATLEAQLLEALQKRDGESAAVGYGSLNRLPTPSVRPTAQSDATDGNRRSSVESQLPSDVSMRSTVASLNPGYRRQPAAAKGAPIIEPARLRAIQARLAPRRPPLFARAASRSPRRPPHVPPRVALLPRHAAPSSSSNTGISVSS